MKMNVIISNVKAGPQEVTLCKRPKRRDKHFICNGGKGYLFWKEEAKKYLDISFAGLPSFLTLPLDQSDFADVLVTSNRHKYQFTVEQWPTVSHLPLSFSQATPT